MKILCIGDTHGDSQSICNIAIPMAVRNDIKLIVQVGDFGYWEHLPSGKRFLDTVSKKLVQNGIEMCWLDGNHENHPMLWEKYPTERELDPRADYHPDFCEIRPNLWYMPRGSTFQLGHVKCLALGGAFSIDKGWRVQQELREAGLLRWDQYIHEVEYQLADDFEHTLWWPTEMIATGDATTAMENAEADGPIDLMFTHDAPEGVSVPGLHAADKWKYPETNQNRELLRQVFDVAQPKLLVHGHYHTAYTGRLPLKEEGWGCRVEGLSNDGQQGFSIILDLDQLFPVES